MPTQRRLLPPWTSIVKSSLFTHAHSSLLSWAARLHRSCANHSCYTMAGLFPGRPHMCCKGWLSCTHQCKRGMCLSILLLIQSRSSHHFAFLLSSASLTTSNGFPVTALMSSLLIPLYKISYNTAVLQSIFSPHWDFNLAIYQFGSNKLIKILYGLGCFIHWQ